MAVQSQCPSVHYQALSRNAKTNGKPTSHPSSRPPPHPRATAISTKASGQPERSRPSLHVPHHTMRLCSRGHHSCRASPSPPVRRRLSVASYAARSKTPTCTSRTPSFSQTLASHLTFRTGISDLLRTSRQAIILGRGGGQLLRRWACLVARSDVAGE